MLHPIYLRHPPFIYVKPRKKLFPLSSLLGGKLYPRKVQTVYVYLVSPAVSRIPGKVLMVYVPGFSSGKPHSGKSPDGLVGEVQGIPRRDVNHFWYNLIIKKICNQLFVKYTLYHIFYSAELKLKYQHNIMCYKQCCGSGSVESVCFWASRIQIRIH
jgi:hypothetical protein